MRGPSNQELLAVGMFGIVLYSSIILLSLCFLTYRNYNKDGHYFYSFIILTAILQLPLYFDLAINQSSNAIKSTLPVNIISNLFFYYALMTVIFTFAHILELSPNFNLFYSKKGKTLLFIYT